MAFFKRSPRSTKVVLYIRNNFSYSTISHSNLTKGSGDKFLSFQLKEIPKQYVEVNYRIFTSALSSDIFLGTGLKVQGGGGLEKTGGGSPIF